ncbi:hypothetical protein EKO27_g3155 [Xylaria grammica]|uniref:Uncharacterized protein n=1 Tax=Xylaria grammica TaxID=363999 RepID=A0A439DC11_9PEZI|nr:hypothetical protein EKO27_g3155 [Xylaria grammica]
MKCFITALMAALASLALAVDPVVDSSVAESTTESVATEVTLLPWPTRRTTTLSTSTSTSSSFIITVTTLPGKPTVTPVACPTVTLTTRPANCQPIRLCPLLFRDLALVTAKGRQLKDTEGFGMAVIKTEDHRQFRIAI